MSIILVNAEITKLRTVLVRAARIYSGLQVLITQLLQRVRKVLFVQTDFGQLQVPNPYSLLLDAGLKLFNLSINLLLLVRSSGNAFKLFNLSSEVVDSFLGVRHRCVNVLAGVSIHSRLIDRVFDIKGCLCRLRRPVDSGHCGIEVILLLLLLDFLLGDFEFPASLFLVCFPSVQVVLNLLDFFVRSPVCLGCL
ncbi:hypothetical protein D3C81_1469880 [compost metagenome]